MSCGVKYCVRLAVLILGLLCAAGIGLAQTKEAKAQHAAIRIAKAALISTFDSSLPRISLEYFLEYEAGKGSLSWEATPCPLTPSMAKRGGSTCVLAIVQFRDGRVAMVSIAVGKVEQNVQVRSVMITNENGAVRKLRLIELPAAIRRNWRKIRIPQFSSDVPA